MGLPNRVISLKTRSWQKQFSEELRIFRLRLNVLNIRDVAEYQLCCGCGVCAYLAPESIEIVDTLDHGRRPVVTNGFDADHKADEAFLACPGHRLAHDFDQSDQELIRELVSDWGPIRAMWEGHAADAEIRLAGSSGGAATAIALFCIEKLGFHGVLHIAARKDVPYLNETVMSRSRSELLARTGSRYAPASPCDGLQKIEDAPGPCVFIGKPCDVAAVQKARKLRPKLDEKIGLTIAFFCAGTPTTRGTLELLRRVGVTDPASVRSLRYRGNGWPGKWTVTFNEANKPIEEQTLTYEESWGLLARHKQWRCNICPDHTGEFADIAVGDPWYRKIQNEKTGQSLVLARTKHGLKILDDAISKNAVLLEHAEDWKLAASQTNLRKTRGAVWGRLVVLRLAGVPIPDFQRLPMFGTWLKHLSLGDRLRSLLGTLRRVRRRRLKCRQQMTLESKTRPAVHGFHGVQLRCPESLGS